MTRDRAESPPLIVHRVQMLQRPERGDDEAIGLPDMKLAHVALVESDATANLLGLAGELLPEDAEHLRREVNAVDRHAAPGDRQEHPPGAAGHLEHGPPWRPASSSQNGRSFSGPPVGGVGRVVVSGGRFVEAPLGIGGGFRTHGYSVRGKRWRARTKIEPPAISWLGGFGLSFSAWV